jgi:hypothetical protein
MTTLFTLFYIPALFGALLIAISLVVVFAPWRFIWECVILTLTIMCIFFMFWVDEFWRWLDGRTIYLISSYNKL